MTKTVALVVAAGRGRRFGGDLPKQYAPLAGSVVLRHTVTRFLHHPGIDAVRCVVHPDDLALYDRAVAGLRVLDPVEGGTTRQQSVRRGLQSLIAGAPDQVLIHDGARPFVSSRVIDGVLEALADHAGALPATPVADTLKRAHDGQITATVARAGLWCAQTPQGFHFQDILQAHNQLCDEDLTDDAQLFERTTAEVVLTPGSADNFKITTPEDLMRAQRFLNENSETRTAQGFDVHRYGPGSHVTLCGVKIPHSHGLVGHSDADVALHALTDALLGTIGAGDIGQHFPPTDAQWKGVASDRFLRHGADLIRDRGGSIVNVDVTLICEAPKITPHRNAMVQRLAQLLDLVADRVSVKATTSEGLGYTGRGEGLAAQALATVRVPT